MLSETRPSKAGTWTEPALRVLRERYLTRKGEEVLETPEEMCWRVAQSIAAGETRYGRSPAAALEVATAFYEMMVDGYFLPNSPTLMNAGKNNGLQYSACYVLPVGDSMEEIFDAVKDAAIIHKSGGGCISGDARVWTTFCGLEPIEVLVNRAIADGRAGERNGAGVAFDVGDLNISTVAMDPATGETGLRRVTHVWRFDVPDELQILVETREGTQVQTSAWHPFMVVRPKGLVAVRADELAPGDVILGPERPDAYWPSTTRQRAGSLVIDESIGWLVGFTLGDGSFGYVPALRQYRLRWFSGEPDVLDKVRVVLAERGIHVGIQRDSRGLLSVATLTQRFVLEMLEACGLQKIGAKDERVRIPEVVAKSPLSVVRAFVAGLLDSDGYVARDGSPSYATASREMVEDLAGLMSLLGYQPSLAVKPPRGKGKRTIYSVQLCTLPQVDELRADIARYAASGHKRTRLTSGSRKQTALRLPFRPWRDRLRDLGLVGASRRGVGPCSTELSRWSCNQNRRCRRGDLLAIADAVASRDAGLGGLLRRVATRGLEVAAVRRAPEPKTFYDLSVEGWNTYAAGTHGMAFVHNTGFAFSRLRPKDDVVASTGGRASGPVSFLRVFNAATEAVKQGGTRRGANMGILRVDHPDILEFIECKLDGGITNFNISVAATDTFMDALYEGQEYDLINPHTGKVTDRLSAQEVFNRIVRAAWRTGDPGMVFIDRINVSPANPTPEVGMVEATNPCGEQPLLGNEACFASETRISTDQGLETVADLYDRQRRGEPVLVATNLNGRGMHIVFRSAVVIKVGVKSTVRVTLTNGQQIRVTPDHQILTERGWKAAGTLSGEDHVLIQTGMAGPVSITTTDGDLQRMFGWFTGDGWFTNSIGLTFGPEDELAFTRLVPVWRRFTGSATRVQTQAATMVRCIATERSEAIAAFHAHGFTPGRGPEKRVPKPIFTAPKEEQIRYLQGLFGADGSKTHRKPQVTLTSASLELLRDVQVLLLNLGMRSNIKYYSHRPTGRAWGQLKVNGESYHRFLDLIGFPLTPRKQERCEQFLWQRIKQDRLAIPVASVIAEEETEVYDVSEPVTHSLIAEGMIVHNCNLGSLNVSKFAKQVADGSWTIDWEEMERIIRLSVRFLDDVIEMNPYPLPAIDKTVKANRRIGLGIMGWADLLFTLGIPYDRDEAIDLAAQVMAFVKEKSHDQSARLAEERGPFPNWGRSIYKNGRPMRNSTVTTIAPTGTISMIAGCSSGIEPTFALAFEHRVKQGEGERVLTFVNETFEAIARREGFYSEALLQEIARRGTLHGIPGLPAKAELVFKTAHEISFEWHVRHQAAFQRYTDNGVSKTINLPNRATEEDVAGAYRLAWESGCLGITVFRDGCKGEQVLNVGVSAKKELQALAAIAPSSKSQAVIKPRPHSLTGATYRMETPIGTAFITVNETEDGEPFEVFVQVGKGGSDTMAVAEALGRLISLVLRLPSPFSAGRRLEEVISQLSRIGGSQPTGFGASKVLSLPDALARTLAEHIGQLQPAGGAADAGNGAGKRIGDLCKECGQATFIYEEGCKKCLSCGFNEC